jgi:hypothetical protein
MRSHIVLWHVISMKTVLRRDFMRITRFENAVADDTRRTWDDPAP